MARSLLLLVTTIAWLSSLTGCDDNDDRPADIQPNGSRRFDVAPGGLDAGLAAARDGDVLRLAPGEYARFETSKAVRILGRPGAVIVQPDAALPVRVRDVGAGRAFALVDVELRGPAGDAASARIVAEDCLGGVVFDGVTGGAFQSIGCDQVVLVGCRGRIDAQDTGELVAIRCDLVGERTAAGTEFAVQVSDSEATIADGAVTGAPEAEAVVVAGVSRVRLASIEGLTVRSGSGVNRAAPIGVGANLVVADPAVVLDPPQAIANEEFLAARVGTTRVGSTVVMDLGAPPATTATWLFGPLAPRSIQEGVTGRVWVDPEIADGIAFTTGEKTRVNTQVPPVDSLTGAILVVQGFATTGAVRASVPGITVIR